MTPVFYGYEWPQGTTRELAGLIVGKKWREFAAAGAVSPAVSMHARKGRRK